MKTYKVIFTELAEKSLGKYKRSNPSAFKKVIKLVEELHVHPYSGTGHPEPLLQGNSVTYSRRINKKDRLVYDVYDETIVVLILSVESHYSQK